MTTSLAEGRWLDDAPGIFAVFTRWMGERGLRMEVLAELEDQTGFALFDGQGGLQPATPGDQLR